MSLRHKIIITVLICVLSVSGSLLFSQKATFHIEGDGVGYVLLNEIILTFEDTGKLSKEEFIKKTNAAMARFFTEARKAKDDGKIDEVFFERYCRILRVFKLVMANFEVAPLLNPLIESEANQFASRNKLILGDEKKVGIGSVAGAIAEELLSLKQYLDEKSGKTKTKTKKTSEN